MLFERSRYFHIQNIEDIIASGKLSLFFISHAFVGSVIVDM